MSIRDVARRANVSISTVSRIINHVDSVDPEIAERVRKVIREMNFFPNTQARALVSGRSRILGLLVSDITNPFFPELIRGFEEIAVEQGFEVLLSSTNYDPDRMALGVRRMLERKVEGVAVMTSEMKDSLIAQLAERRVPLVFVDVGPQTPGVANIRVDYSRGINQAIQHLLRQGHRRMGFVSGPLDLKSARIRRQAFLQALAENRVEVDPALMVEGRHSFESGVRAVSQLFGVRHPPSAVLASNDLTAIGLLTGLNREGLRVPDDISVVGFDDIHLAEFTIPPLTTIRLSRIDLAKKAFEALMAEIAKPARRKTKSRYEVETNLVVRGSTGMLKRA